MLKIDDLTVTLESDREPFYILRSLDLHLLKGEILGIAGESGSGKSVLAREIIGLNFHPIKKKSGIIYFNDRELKSADDFKAVRGGGISMIFQNPTSSINPVIPIGKQIVETIMLHDKKISKHLAENKAIELLRSVEIDMPEKRMHDYAHQLSGGMNQRVMIALALATNPKLLIADEPTTALDVTIQKQIISLIKKLNKELGLSVIFISHDLSLLQNIAQRVIVLYSGEVLEVVSSEALRENRAANPYTKALKACVPHIKTDGELSFIKGFISKNTSFYDDKCIFYERCEMAVSECSLNKPNMKNDSKCFF